MSQKLFAFSLATIALIVTPNLAHAEQVIIQSGSSSARAEGANNFAASGVSQSAGQNQFGYGDPNQLIIQNGNVNSNAIGQNNTVIGNINQAAQQNQSFPSGEQTAIQDASGNYVGIGADNTVYGNTQQMSNQGQW